MQDIIEQYAEKRAQRAVAENDKKVVEKLLGKGMSVEEIARLLDLTEAHVRELADKRSA